MTKKAKLVFFGNERLSSSLVPSLTPVLRNLIAADYEICAIVVTNKPQTSRKQRALEVAEVAQEYNIPILYVDTLKDVSEQLQSYEAEAGILAAFGKIVPQSIIDIFPKGIINIHPSNLPEFRGSTPIESTILSGQTETAVSIMSLDAGMDTGPLYGKTAVQLDGTETKAELTEALANIGAQTLLQILPNILDGSHTPKAQTNKGATYTARLEKSVGELDFIHKDAQRLAREVRAYLGWPSSVTEINDNKVVVTKVHTAKLQGAPGAHFITDEKNIGIFCKKDALIIEQLKPAGKGIMAASDFANGYLK